MHISDGVLSAPVLISGFVGTAAITAATIRKMDLEEIPKISVITAVFFVASLIKIPAGPTSVHLILNGLVGVILGWRAFPAILLGLILQALLFGHGGVTAIGVNAISCTAITNDIRVIANKILFSFLLMNASTY